MLNDFLNPKFEIEITNRNGRIEAFCAVFPECFGIGGSEKEAIEDLADSIALYLGDVVKSTVNDIVKGGILRHVEPVKEIKNKTESKIAETSKKKSTFVFPGSIKNDLNKLEHLFTNNSKKPIMRGGILSILGLNPVVSPLNVEKKEMGYSSRHFLPSFMADPLGNSIDFIDHCGVEEIRGPEGILLGIPLSFN